MPKEIVFCCFSGGLVSLHLCGGGLTPLQLTTPRGWRPARLLSASRETVLPDKKPGTLTRVKAAEPPPQKTLILPSCSPDVKSHVPGAIFHLLGAPAASRDMSGSATSPPLSVPSSPLTFHLPYHLLYVDTDAADIAVCRYSWGGGKQKTK